MARRYVEKFAGKTRPRRETVERFLVADESFQRAWERRGDGISIHNWVVGAARMQPVSVAGEWGMPAIESEAKLAAWLNLNAAELEWFADLKGLNCRHRDARIDHYSYKLVTKRSGSVRLIETPKQHLRMIQRKILSEVLNRVQVHPAVHGFVSGRSIRSFAAPHVGHAVVFRMDVEDFFPTFGGRRVQRLIRTLGYPERVADLLGGLCTNAVAHRWWKAFTANVSHETLHDARRLYARPHLPQGAPTSPAIANLCFYRVDCRLAGLAHAAGAVYTRYADDLAFSGEGEFARAVERFSLHVAAILLEMGFAVNHHKTRIMRRGTSQRLTGLVINQHLNVPREVFDELKATLTNCVRHGWLSQNRDGHADFRAHLAGRVAFVESINPGKGARLRRVFEQIVW